MALPGSLPRGLRSRLEAAGLTSLDAISALSARELLDLPGIGPGALKSIADALGSAGLDFAVDEWGPYTCARHGEPSWDTQLESMFLCKACASKFQKIAFARTEPSYVGGTAGGYCLHCNELRNVRLHQWFLCGVCNRVMRSIGRSVVADRYVSEWWNEAVQEHVPDLDLKLVDEPELRSRRRDEAPKVSAIDFMGIDRNAGQPLFGIELKTGRSYIRGRSIGSKMNRFQLDHGDCDDITTVVEREKGLPVYLFHAQVIDRAEPPTLRFVGIGLWWTELFAMHENYITSAQRPRETKIAAYYDTRMFREPEEFIAHLAEDGPRHLRRRISRDGIPPLYKS